MFVFWSRTSSSGTCRCRTCIDVTRSLLLRPSGRGSRHLLRDKRSRLADVFTACYTGIFATATLIDTSRKDNRRHRLERELEDARFQLALLQDESRMLEEERKAELARNGESPTPHAHQALDAMSLQHRRIYDRPAEDDPFRPVLDLGFDCASVLTREALRARVMTDWGQLERGVLGEEEDDNHWQRISIKPSHLLDVEYAIARCVDKMMYFITYGLYWNNGCPELTSTKLRPALRRIWEARHEGYPRYALDSTNGMWFNRQMLRASYAASHYSLHMDFVATICYNLLVFTGEPRISTFNMLIVIMDRLGLHRLSKVVIGKFFHDLVVIPTEMTTAVLLNHYKILDEAWSFYRVLRGMVARRKMGHKIWRKRLSDMMQPERAFGLRQRAQDLGAVQYQDYVIARVRITWWTVNAVLEGLLRFEQLHHAVDIFVGALKDGIKISARLFALLLDHCLAALDWQAAVRLVAGMAAEAGKISELVTNINAQHILEDRIERVLDLAGFPPELGSGFISRGTSAGKSAGESTTLHHLFDIDERGFESLRLALHAKGLQARLDDLKMASEGEIYASSPHNRMTTSARTKWSTRDVQRLKAYGLSQQVEHSLDLAADTEQDFFDSISSRFRNLARKSNPALSGFVAGIAARLVDRAEQDFRKLQHEVRMVRVSTISYRLRNFERDLLPLRERLATVRGIATQRRVQLAEIEGVRIETEMLKITRIAAGLRVRAVEAETSKLWAEVAATATQGQGSAWKLGRQGTSEPDSRQREAITLADREVYEAMENFTRTTLAASQSWDRAGRKT